MTETGFTEQQAQALSEEQAMLLNTNLATKTDIAQVEAALKADIADLIIFAAKWVSWIVALGVLIVMFS